MFGTNTYHFADDKVYDVMQEHKNWDFSTEELKAKAEALICQGDLTTTIASPTNQSSLGPKTPTPPTSTVTIEEIVDQPSSQPTESKLEPQTIAELPKQVPCSTLMTQQSNTPVTTQQSNAPVIPQKQQFTSAPTTSVSYKDAVLTKPISRVCNVKVVQPLGRASDTKSLTLPKPKPSITTISPKVLPATRKNALETNLEGFLTVKTQQSTQTCKIPE